MKRLTADNIYHISLISTILFVFLIGLLFTFGKVDGSSMMPTLEDGCYVFSVKHGVISKGDIIEAKSVVLNEGIIKRVIGTPGDIIEFRDNKVYINGMEESFEFSNYVDYSKVEGQIYKLDEDEYFIMGDNRNISKDSRSIGPIKRKEIRGRVIFSFK